MILNDIETLIGQTSLLTKIVSEDFTQTEDEALIRYGTKPFTRCEFL